MPGQVRRIRRKRHPRFSWLRGLELRSGLILSGFVLFGFVVGLFAFSSAREGVRHWREGRFLRSAGAQFDQGHLEEAETLALRARELNPNSLAAADLLADITEKQNRADTVTWRAQIAQLDPSLDHQLNLVSAALRFGELDVARRALQQVTLDDRQKAAYHVVAGWLSRAEGNKAEEERHFAAAVAQDPSNDLYKFNLAVLQIQSPEPEKNAAARNELERLSKVAEFRTEALRALLDDALRQNQTGAADDLAQELQMSPQVTFADYLRCLDLYRKLSPKKFDALLDKVRPVAARHPQDLAQLLDWMNQHELENEALKWSDKLPDEVTSRPPVAPAVAASLALTKSWSRLKRWTRSGSWGEEDYLRLAYQAYALLKARRSSVEAEFDSLWSSALGAAGNHPERQLALARLASKWQLTEKAEALWLGLAQTPTARREALDALYRIYRASNDLDNLRLTAERLHDASPEEVELSANAARFALLLDQNVAKGRNLARQAYERAPNDPNAAVSYAFALYGMGRTPEGIDVLKKLSPEQLREPHAAVYAALLFDDDNQAALADEYLALARRGSIFPEEKQLLDEIAARRRAAVEAGRSPSPP